MKNKHQKSLLVVGLSVLLLLTLVTNIRAQGYPPGFDLRIEWEHFEEQSKDRREMDVSQMGARMGYSLPQTFDIYVALSWQDLNARLNGSDIDLDPALAFRVGGKVYAVRAIPMGVPADFTIALSYSTAKHEEATTKEDYSHRRIIGMGGLEWRYVNTVPYLNFGILYSELEAPLEEFDQTSLLISAGVYAPILENVYLRAEVNVVQEIGYAMGLQFRF
ncbi:MAG: hypothetical protein ACMUIM_03640 [bacterium]